MRNFIIYDNNIVRVMKEMMDGTRSTFKENRNIYKTLDFKGGTS
jgi:hypothetical protein